MTNDEEKQQDEKPEEQLPETEVKHPEGIRISAGESWYVNGE